MKKCEELALAVLEEAGIIEPDKSWWKFKESVPVETRVLQETVNRESRSLQSVEVMPGRLPWLRVIEVREGDYMPKTKEQRILCAFKMAKGIDWKDRDWDKAMFTRYVRSAKQLLSAFTDEQLAAEFLLEFGDEMREAGLDWGLDAAVRRAWNSKGEREARS